MGQLFVEALVLAMVAALVAVTFAQLAWHSLFAMVTENMFDRVPFWSASVSPRTLVYAGADARRRRYRRTSPGLKVTRGVAPEAVRPRRGVRRHLASSCRSRSWPSSRLP